MGKVIHRATQAKYGLGALCGTEPKEGMHYYIFVSSIEKQVTCKRCKRIMKGKVNHGKSK
jgi:hypothetical protein